VGVLVVLLTLLVLEGGAAGHAQASAVVLGKFDGGLRQLLRRLQRRVVALVQPPCVPEPVLRHLHRSRGGQMAPRRCRDGVGAAEEERSPRQQPSASHCFGKRRPLRQGRAPPPGCAGTPALVWGQVRCRMGSGGSDEE
jgi:hypothetical protein